MKVKENTIELLEAKIAYFKQAAIQKDEKSAKQKFDEMEEFGF